MPVSLRSATIADAPFLATCLMEALGGQVMEHMLQGTVSPEEESVLRRLTALAQRDDTLYSWRCATIAYDEAALIQRDDTLDSWRGAMLVGATIAYDGGEYATRRAVTFTQTREQIPFDITAMEDESQAGEYYLDTLAVLPQYRRHGIARQLMLHWLAEAKRCQLRPTLTAAYDNAAALALYHSLGLRPARKIFIFGDWYMKMIHQE